VREGGKASARRRRWTAKPPGGEGGGGEGDADEGGGDGGGGEAGNGGGGDCRGDGTAGVLRLTRGDDAPT